MPPTPPFTTACRAALRCSNSRRADAPATPASIATSVATFEQVVQRTVLVIGSYSAHVGFGSSVSQRAHAPRTAAVGASPDGPPTGRVCLSLAMRGHVTGESTDDTVVAWAAGQCRAFVIGPGFFGRTHPGHRMIGVGGADGLASGEIARLATFDCSSIRKRSTWKSSAADTPCLNANSLPALASAAVRLAD